MTATLAAVLLLTPAKLTKPQMVALVSRAAKLEKVDLSDGCKDAMVSIAWHESRWNPSAQNKRSSAYGLFQFLNRTWESTGIRKTSDPLMQTRAALKYMMRRYKTPSRAGSFRDRRGWY